MTGKSLHNGVHISSSLDELQAALAPLTASPQSTAIFFDLDGTLAPIVARPDMVSVPASISKLVRKLQHAYLAVTVISGRPATEARRIMGNSELTYIGNHGFETMLPGHAVTVSEEVQPYLAPIKALLEICRSMEEMVLHGILVEDKTATMSLHYRQSPDPEAAQAFIQERIIPLAQEKGLRPSGGRKVMEFRPPVEVNKGVSMGRLLDLLDARQALFMGDDTTDIDALKEIRKRGRRKGAVMIGVGVISAEMPPDLPKYSDLLVERNSGVEMVLQILAGEEL